MEVDADEFMKSVGLAKVLRDLPVAISRAIEDIDQWVNLKESLEKIKKVEEVDPKIMLNIRMAINRFKIPVDPEVINQLDTYLSGYYQIKLNLQKRGNVIQKADLISRLEELKNKILKNVNDLENSVEKGKKPSDNILKSVDLSTFYFDEKMMKAYVETSGEDKELPPLIIKKDSFTHEGIKKLAELISALSEKELDSVATQSTKNILEKVEKEGKVELQPAAIHPLFTNLVMASVSLLATHVETGLEKPKETKEKLKKWYEIVKVYR